MRIKTAHKILIASAIVFFIFFGIWELKDYTKTGEIGALGTGLLSVLAAVGFVIYFRSLQWKDF
ncbi:MAG: hypothetical protein ACE5JQ_04495 [Candidatus Methylomirabilales bacterium]